MENNYQELKEIYRRKEVVPQEKLDWTVTTIIRYAKGLSKLTGIDADYFIDIMKHVDSISFLDNQEDSSLELDMDCHRTLSLQKEGKLSIFINDDRQNYQEDGLIREMINICIQYVLGESQKLEKRNLGIKKDSRLYEGVVEDITQKVFSIINLEQESIGEKESRYFMEIQIADTLMDVMGKSLFLKMIFLNPNDILEKIEQVSYEGKSLLDYLDEKMVPLIPYRGDYNHKSIKSVDILDSFEAISDCYNLLKLGGISRDEDKSKARQ